MNVELMKKEHYSDLVDLWRKFPGNTLTGADEKAAFTRFLSSNGDYCFVALDDDILAGSVMAGNDQRRGYIYHLAVDESLQGRGIGRALMEASENALRNAGIEKIHLFIYSDNPAIRFYSKIGWHVRNDITVMSKVLIGDEYMGTRKDN
ncbi:MAG: GNAT family N-acetyltransferase [Candidatus Aegiribacteria sp.]|nr:GNAT family N-acetyltransferase [Candidatus Aegiribacteria sp.]MBD3295577.1 GNAT family N-acetyltransferase [Candidatus Fermentibacteria bacterium]